MKDNKTKSTFKFNPIIYSVTVGVGVILGLIFNNLVIGISLGAGIGLLINLQMGLFKGKNKE